MKLKWANKIQNGPMKLKMSKSSYKVFQKVYKKGNNKFQNGSMKLKWANKVQNGPMRLEMTKSS